MIKITFPDGSVREYEAGVTGLQIAESISSRLAQDVLACGVNGEIVELNRPINEDASVVLYKWEDAEGKHAFWHTSAHLMAEAMQELYPGMQFGIGPAIENGFYYDVMPPAGTVIRESDFAGIEKKMLELAQRKEPVVRAEISKADALKFFGERGQTYKNELIEDFGRRAYLYLHPRSFHRLVSRSALDEYGCYQSRESDGCIVSVLARRREASADDSRICHFFPEKEDAGRVFDVAGRSQEARPS